MATTCRSAGRFSSRPSKDDDDWLPRGGFTFATYTHRSVWSYRYMDRIGLGPRHDDPHKIILAGHCRRVYTLLYYCYKEPYCTVPLPGLIRHSDRAATSPLRHGPLSSPSWQTAPVQCHPRVGVVFDHRIRDVGAHRKGRIVGASPDYYITVAGDQCQSHPIRLSSLSGNIR